MLGWLVSFFIFAVHYQHVIKLRGEGIVEIWKDTFFSTTKNVDIKYEPSSNQASAEKAFIKIGAVFRSKERDI